MNGRGELADFPKKCDNNFGHFFAAIGKLLLRTCAIISSCFSFTPVTYKFVKGYIVFVGICATER